MVRNTTPPRDADRTEKQIGTATTPTNRLARAIATLPAEIDTADRLIDFREVYGLIGSNCRTSHTARALAARGQIKAVRINERVLRYSLHSVLELVNGRVQPVAINGTVTAA